MKSSLLITLAILSVFQLVQSSTDRVFTLEELKKYNGKDENLPIYMAIKGLVYDVSKGRDFYGYGKPYGVFAGKDATRAVAKWSKNESDMTSDLTGLSREELAGLDKTIETLYSVKYSVVGRMDYFKSVKGEL